MYNYNKSVPSPYDPTKLAIHSILLPEDDLISNCGPNLKKNVSFDDVVHFIDEENMVTYVDFDCGITFFPETPTKIRQINRERIYISRPCEKPQCIPSNDQHTCVVDEQHSSNICLNPYNLWDMVPPALMSLRHNRLQPIVERRNLHLSRQRSGFLGDVILNSDLLATTLRESRQQCIKIDQSLTMC